MRLMVYSHDSFGLGNIRRMLAICQHLLNTTPGLSILLISGSPVLHSFRMPKGLDYIKLPCLGRNQFGAVSVKYLETTTDEGVKLRSEIILTAAVHFRPDLFLVDKKPYGLEGELKTTLNYIKSELPKAKLILLLRDILDSPEVTVKQWQKYHYYDALQCYDKILVVGTPEIFDLPNEYQFSAAITQKVRFCGYIRREAGRKPRHYVRQELQIQSDEQLVLVTPGGGADGYRLINTYLSSLACLSSQHQLKSLIIYGPEMPLLQKQALVQAAEPYSQIQMLEFTDDLASYMEAADTVVCMGGYNTICEILSLNKRAIVVPRIQPVQEQWLRAERMAQLGLFKAVHPDYLTPQRLIDAVLEQLSRESNQRRPIFRLNLDALPQISQELVQLVYSSTTRFKAKKTASFTQLSAQHA